MKVPAFFVAAAAFAFLAAPVAVQASQTPTHASPSRATSPTEQGSELRSSWILGFLALAAIIAAIIIATKGDNGPVSS